MEVKIKLKRDRLLIKVIPPSKETETGILLSEIFDDIPTEGTIVAIGSDCKENEVGDIVLIGKYGMDLVNIDGMELVLTTEEFIIGKR